MKNLGICKQAHVSRSHFTSHLLGNMKINFYKLEEKYLLKVDNNFGRRLIKMR